MAPFRLIVDRFFLVLIHIENGCQSPIRRQSAFCRLHASHRDDLPITPCYRLPTMSTDPLTHHSETIAGQTCRVLALVAAGTTTIPCPPDAPWRSGYMALAAQAGAKITHATDALQVTGTGNGCLLTPDSVVTPRMAGLEPDLVVGLFAPLDMTCRFADPGSDTSPALLAMLRATATRITRGDALIDTHGAPFAIPVEADMTGAPVSAIVGGLLAALSIAGTTRLTCDASTQLDAACDVFGLFGVMVQRTSRADGCLTLSLEGQANVVAADACAPAPQRP